MTTTYDAVATRSGDWWAIEITSGLPDNMLGVSQARSLDEVEDVARSVVADLLEIEPSEIGIHLIIAPTREPDGTIPQPAQPPPSASRSTLRPRSRPG